MFDYLSSNWSRETAVHLSAYVMWRLNWIHPFSDGNGRTSRILSYMVLCSHLGKILPGVPTIPEQISESKKPYNDALDAADAAFERGKIDVGEMERLIEGYLANQLVMVHQQATGKTLPLPSKKDASRPIVGWIEGHPTVITVIGILVTIILAVLGLT